MLRSDYCVLCASGSSILTGIRGTRWHSASGDTLGTHANGKRPLTLEDHEGVFAGQGPFQAPTGRPSGHAGSDVVVELELVRAFTAVADCCWLVLEKSL